MAAGIGWLTKTQIRKNRGRERAMQKKSECEKEEKKKKAGKGRGEICQKGRTLPGAGCGGGKISKRAGKEKGGGGELGRSRAWEGEGPRFDAKVNGSPPAREQTHV